MLHHFISPIDWQVALWHCGKHLFVRKRVTQKGDGGTQHCFMLSIHEPYHNLLLKYSIDRYGSSLSVNADKLLLLLLYTTVHMA